MTTARPDTLMDVIRLRRSVRVFIDRPIYDDVLESIGRSVEVAARAWDIRSARIIIAREPGLVRRLRRAVFSGLLGKINPWMVTTKAPAIIVACGYPEQSPSPSVGDRMTYLAEASMLMEVTLLAAAEHGLGTCWLGGFGESGVKRALSLDDRMRVVAVSPLGYPSEKIRAESGAYMREGRASLRRMELDELVTMVEGT